MSVEIGGIEKGSIAERNGFCMGDQLDSINGYPVDDVLDYRFHMINARLGITGKTAQGKPFSREIVKENPCLRPSVYCKAAWGEDPANHFLFYCPGVVRSPVWKAGGNDFSAFLHGGNCKWRVFFSWLWP